MSKMKRLLTNARVWILIAALVLALVAINPRLGAEGIAIKSVDRNSSAALAGIQSPEPGASPVSRERVLEVNGVPVSTVEGFYGEIAGYPPNRSLTITTDRNTYRLTTGLNETDSLGLTVAETPRSNLRLGLDLSGGSRVVLKPVEPVSDDDLTLITDNIKQRLNVYGLSDIVVRSARDLDGEDFIIVEIAGANRDEVTALLGSQGKFEARLGNETVFRGGGDVTSVCRSAACSRIEQCGPGPNGYACSFSFQITLSPEAAGRQAQLTDSLTVQYEGGEGFLSQPLDLYLDDELVDSLRISSDLKGRAVTQILITGGGEGPTQRAAAEDTLANMRQLQTVLVTGSLPVRLEIVKSDAVSPAIGGEFVRNAVLLGVLSILAVAVVLMIRYRQPLVSIPIVITMLSEITIILGFAALTGWNLDLAAIAAIVIAIGSGVDDQIVMIDETLRGDKERRRTWKERIGGAFFIILAAYFTLAAAMVPLFFAGAGLLRGFAITTLVGITAGVFITRPAFAQFMELLLKKDDEE